jgi:hypothetical protein
MRPVEETAQPAQQIGLIESDLAWPAVADLEVTAAELDGFEQEVGFDDRVSVSGYAGGHHSYHFAR